MRCTHLNSRLAHAELADRSLSRRQQEVLACVRRLGAATDRQLRDALGMRDMNGVRPRVTELIGAGRLEECATTVDPETNKRVRVVRIRCQITQRRMF